jgi:phosphoribosylaminoimidazole-succinocarboxamide synthase
VVVKSRHVGTPKHIYKGLETMPTRNGQRILNGSEHTPYVRFDWRNPLPQRDECMPLDLADYFIDTQEAKTTALAAFGKLRDYMVERGLHLIDICLFITADGREIFSEISPDCMRFEFLSRQGVSNESDLTDERLIQRWSRFLELIRGNSVSH